MACALCLALAARAWAAQVPPIQTVFLIVMENQDWSTIKDNTNCPFINNVLLPQAAYCERYYTPPGLHPSEPNYLWLVAGTNFGILNNDPPAVNTQSTTNHLAFLLDQAGVSWKTYQFGISGLDCPTVSTNLYLVTVNPFAFFNSITSNSAYCVSHMRPESELDMDLTNQTVPRFSFISPGLCNAMHWPCTVKDGDNWLSSAVPKILGSAAYRSNGALFITWDEGTNAVSDGPIGMILLSPLGKGGGYHNQIRYTHSSILRTFQNIFGVMPYLGTVAGATDLGDLFQQIEIMSPAFRSDGTFTFAVSSPLTNQTHYVQVNADLATTHWLNLSTNVPLTGSFTFEDRGATNGAQRFYRVAAVP